MSLELTTEGEGGGRRTSQEFRDLCKKFDGGLEEGVVEDAKQKSGRDPVCSFSSLAGNSPGPISGRRARRKLIQTKLSFENRMVRGHRIGPTIDQSEERITGRPRGGCMHEEN